MFTSASNKRRAIEGITPAGHEEPATELDPLLDPVLEGQPWVRYWARVIDTNLLGFPIALLAALSYPAFYKLPRYLYGPLLLLATFFFEALLIATWGTTPGKAWLGVRLRKMDGAKLRYGEALLRGLKVFVMGMGLGIPFIAIFTTLNARSTLLRQGQTAWDRQGGFLITHQDIPAWRIGMVVLLLAASFIYVLLRRLGV